MSQIDWSDIVWPPESILLDKIEVSPIPSAKANKPSQESICRRNKSRRKSSPRMEMLLIPPPRTLILSPRTLQVWFGVIMQQQQAAPTPRCSRRPGQLHSARRPRKAARKPARKRPASTPSTSASQRTTKETIEETIKPMRRPSSQSWRMLPRKWRMLWRRPTAGRMYFNAGVVTRNSRRPGTRNSRKY